MCIAIYKPADKVLSRELLNNCFTNNDDGCGFSYINTNYHGKKKLKVCKFMAFDPFWIKYEKATRLNPESPFIIHFRIKTHGTKNIENCHPFRVDNEHVFIHNGIISGVGFEKDISDTRLFNRVVLRELPKGWFGNQAICKLLADFIGMSKLVIMNINGTVNIINESKGQWHEGCWMSNSSFEPKKTYTTSNYSSYFDSDKGVIKRTVYQKPSNTAVQYSLFSWATCSLCDKPVQIKDMEYYSSYGDTFAVCKACEIEDKLDKNPILFPKDKVNAQKYLQHLRDTSKKEEILALPGTDYEVDDYRYAGMFQ